jgi:6-phosphogluconate dehydrogenase
MNDKGFNVVAYNRTTSKVDYFLANEAKGTFTPRPIYFQSRLTIT